METTKIIMVIMITPTQTVLELIKSTADWGVETVMQTSATRFLQSLQSLYTR